MPRRGGKEFRIEVLGETIEISGRVLKIGVI
jgi:hypothetical protein